MRVSRLARVRSNSDLCEYVFRSLPSPSMAWSLMILLIVPLVEKLPGNLYGEEHTVSAHGEFGFESVKVGNQSRSYRLVVPQTINLKKPVPLVVAYHGIVLDSNEMMPLYTKLNETAAKHQFLIAYPEAAGPEWGKTKPKELDDLTFFDLLLRDIPKRYEIDADRIYVIGMGNGGSFAHWIARKRSTIVAAIVSHSGPTGNNSSTAINAERKFPVMIIHGENDYFSPVKLARQDRDQYKKEGHEVEYYEVPKAPHTWMTKQNINEKIWKFLDNHSLNQSNGRRHFR